MGKRTSTGRRRRGWLHVRGTRPSKPLDSMAMDSSSDQRTDLTSRGLGGGDGRNPETAGGKGGAGALVLLHHIGQDAPGGQQAVGEHRGEAELLLEGAH